MKFLNYQQKEVIILQTNFYSPLCTIVNTKKYVQAGTRVLLNTEAPVATALNQASNKSLAIIAYHSYQCSHFGKSIHTTTMAQLLVGV